MSSKVSKIQAELLLKNLRERMDVRIRRGEQYCRAAVKLTPLELDAFDFARNIVKLDLMESIVEEQLKAKQEKEGDPSANVN